MHARAGIKVRVIGGDLQHLRQGGKVHADAQRMRHAVGRHRVQHRRKVLRQFGEIKVTVGIDEHGKIEDWRLRIGGKRDNRPERQYLIFAALTGAAAPCSTRRVSTSPA